MRWHEYILRTIIFFAVVILIIPSVAGQEITSRPILYLDIEKKGEEKVALIKGVFPDGKPIDTVVQGIGAAWSPDGTWFAIPAERKLALRNLKGEMKIIFASNDQFVWQPIWSPDGENIAFLSYVPGIIGLLNSYSITVINVAKKKVLLQHQLPSETSLSGWLKKFRWSPDGRRILLVWRNTVVLDTQKDVIETIATKPVLAEWAPNSNAIYYFDGDFLGPNRTLGDFYLKKLDSSSPFKLMDKEEVQSLGLKEQLLIAGLINLSPKGSKLLIASGSFSMANGMASELKNMIYIYDVSKDKMVKLNHPFKKIQTEDVNVALEWAPDENSIAAITIESLRKVRLKILDISEGRWRTLATLNFNPQGSTEELDALGGKILSWTQ